MRIFLLCCLMTPWALCCGQNHHLFDSLRQELANFSSVKDSTYIELLVETAQAGVPAYQTSILSLGQEAVEQSEKIGYPKGIAQGYNMMGIAFAIDDKHETAAMYFQKSLEIHQKRKDTASIITSMHNISGSYLQNTHKQNLQKALELSENALALAQQKGYENKKGDILLGLAMIYHEQAKQYEQEGAHEKAMARRSEAENYLISADSFVQNPYWKVAILQEKAAIQQEWKDWPAAEKSLEELLQIISVESHPADYVEAIREMGSIHLVKQELQAAEDSLLKAYQLASREDLALEQMYCIEALAELFAKQAKYQQASDYMMRYDSLTVNYRSNLKLKLLDDLNERYEIDRKKQENEFLKQEQQLLLKRNRILIAILLSLALFLGMGFFFYRRLRQQKRMLETLNYRKKLLFNVIAKDLREPMLALEDAVTESIEYLQKEEVEKVLAASPQNQEQAQNLQRLLDNLLYWILMQRGDFQIGQESINIYDSVVRVQQQLTQSLFVGNSFHPAIPSDLHIQADADVWELLLKNIFYHFHQQTITGQNTSIEAKRGTAYIELTFSNPSTDISPPPPYSPNHLPDSQYGIELLLTQEIIHRYQAQLKLQQRPDKGTVWTILWPTKQAAS